MNRTILVFIALLNLVASVLIGYLNDWERIRTSLQNFISPKTTFQKILDFVPILCLVAFWGWIAFVNGKRNIKKSLLIYPLVFLIYIIILFAALISTSFLLETYFEHIGVGVIQTLQIIIAIICFISITASFKYVFAKIEKVKISRWDFLIILAGTTGMLIFSFLWSQLLAILIDGDFAKDAYANGGFLFAFILIEGFIFLRIKKLAEYKAFA